MIERAVPPHVMGEGAQRRPAAVEIGQPGDPFAQARLGFEDMRDGMDAPDKRQAPGGVAVRRQRQNRRLWPLGQRAIGVAERIVPVSLSDWHIYSIDWRRDVVTFGVDGRRLLETAHAPSGPLGLVIWLDNQYMQVTPWGRFGWGTLAKTKAEWLEVAWVALERIPAR